MADRPHITVISHEVHAHGGHERAAYELIRRRLDRGAAVTVIARRCEVAPSDLLHWLRVRGPTRPFPVAYLWFFVLGTLLAAIHGKGFRQSVGAITLNRMDAVTVQFCHRGYSERSTQERRNRASLLHTLSARASAALSRLAEWWCYRPSRVRRLVAVSDGLAEELRRCFPRMSSRVTVIPNGVDHGEFRPNPAARARTRASVDIGKDELLAVFLGGDWERKGLPIAMEGVAKTDRWHLLVAGSGDAQALRDLARRFRADARLHLLGRTSRPSAVLAAGDAFVFPTSYEGFSLAALEAAASGLPLLISRVHGTEELLIEGETGWFVDRTSESIRRWLEALAQDPDLRHEMGERARLSTAKYGWDRVVRMYESLYAEELGIDRA